MAGLLHTDFRTPETSYTHLLKVTDYLTHDQREVIEAFRRMVFNVYAFNRDDHAKNFSFVMDLNGEWRLSPAYDLVYSQGYGGWHTMDIGGTQHPNQAQLLALANNQGIKKPHAVSIIEQVKQALSLWPELAKQHAIGKELRDDIDKSLAAINRAA